MAAAIDMTRFTITGQINKRALRKYAEFWAALHAVGEAVVAAEKLAAKAADAQPLKVSKGGRRHWSVPDPDELRATAKKADRSLRIITAAAKKWEAELISRDWRN